MNIAGFLKEMEVSQMSARAYAAEKGEIVWILFRESNIKMCGNK